MATLRMEKGLIEEPCWNCQRKRMPGLFCESCGSIQPISPNADYFSLLGLNRILAIDCERLEKTFHNLSRQLHPDYYQGKSEVEKRISLENSAFINTAYRTLRDPVERVEYLLQLEKSPVEKNQKQPPADLFEEIFEIQEIIEELRNSKEAGLDSKEVLKGKLEEEKKGLEAKRGGLEGCLQTLFDLWDGLVKDGVPSDAKKDDKKRLLEEMRVILARRSYINTIIRDIGKELES